MAYYIKDKRQVNYEQNVKKAMDRLEEREENLPRFRGPKLAIAIIGFAMAVFMILWGMKLGISPAENGYIGPGSIAFLSGIFSAGGGVIALVARQTYLTAPLMIAALVFILALLLPVLHPDTSKLMRGLCLPDGLAFLLSAFYAKTSFDLVKKSGVKYKK